MKAKKVLWGFVGLLAVIIIAVAVVILYAGSLAKVGVEKAGTYALGVKTTLNSADISVFQGKVQLNGLNVANPEGFTMPRLLNIGQTATEVDLGSLMSDKIQVKTLTIRNLDLTLEQKGTSSNLQAVLDNVEKLSSGEAKPSEEEPPGKKMNIGKIEITDSVVHLKLLPIPGKDTSVPLKLAPIVITDLGNDQSTVTIIRKILGALAAGVAQQAGGILPPEMLAGIQGSLGELQKQIGTIPGQVMGEAQKALEQTGEGLKKTTEGVQKQAEDLLKNPFGQPKPAPAPQK